LHCGFTPIAKDLYGKVPLGNSRDPFAGVQHLDPGDLAFFVIVKGDIVIDAFGFNLLPGLEADV
jgi:hypothetical protein